MPPIFLTGPVAALLTNLSGFSAHIVMRSDSLSPVEKNLSGELLGREGKLLFAVEPGKRDKKYSRGGFSFISDVGERQSFVVSEALQGYAPVASGLGPTNITTHTQSVIGQKLDGHTCEVEEAIVEMSDGSHASFQILRAADLNRFPIRISSLSNTPPFTLSFSKIRIGSPSAVLFLPPSGFTKYDSVEVMLTELIMRQQNLKRVRTGATEPVYEYKSRR